MLWLPQLARAFMTALIIIMLVVDQAVQILMVEAAQLAHRVKVAVEQVDLTQHLLPHQVQDQRVQAAAEMVMAPDHLAQVVQV
jgi:hypothetical protein